MYEARLLQTVHIIFYFRSLLDLSENEVNDSKVQEFMRAVYKSAGLRYGSEIRFTDFKRVFASDEYAKTLRKATLELDGKIFYNLRTSKEEMNG